MEKKIKIGLICLIIGIVLVGGLCFWNNQQIPAEENISIEYVFDVCEISRTGESKLTVHTNKITLFFDMLFTKGCMYELKLDEKRDKNVIRLKLTDSYDTVDYDRCFDNFTCFHFQGKIKGLDAGTYILEVYDSDNYLMFKEENISIY